MFYICLIKYLIMEKYIDKIEGYKKEQDYKMIQIINANYSEYPQKLRHDLESRQEVYKEIWREGYNRRLMYLVKHYEERLKYSLDL